MDMDAPSQMQTPGNATVDLDRSIGDVQNMQSFHVIVTFCSMDLLVGEKAGSGSGLYNIGIEIAIGFRELTYRVILESFTFRMTSDDSSATDSFIIEASRCWLSPGSFSLFS